MVAKLDRLSRSLLDFAALMEQARKRGWNLIALDLGVDTSTPAGEMMASVLATFAQFERRLIGQRTKDALAVKRAQGVVLGRPREIPGSTVERIRELHDAGLGAGRHRAEAERGGHRDSRATASGTTAVSEGCSRGSFVREERELVGDGCLGRTGSAIFRTKRPTAYRAPSPATHPSAMTLVVAQVRQALQQTAAVRTGRRTSLPPGSSGPAMSPSRGELCHGWAVFTAS